MRGKHNQAVAAKKMVVNLVPEGLVPVDLLAVVSPAPTTIERSYPAVVLPARQAELAFKVSGRIVELPIRAATEVKKGDLIAQLEKREFEASKKDRSQGLADSYRELMEKYPDDLEPVAFLVNRVWLNRRARIPTKDYEAMEDLLKRIFAENPMHPAEE